jgi:DMSO/TMAO reductase YedYZ molybdopterin-dependent catalytic subunit
MNNKIKKILTINIFLISFSTIFSGCIDNKIILDNVEIREYQGEKLSSILDLRENSIKGPQYLSKENYTLKITGLINKQKNYSYDNILENFKKYEKIITLFCVEGWSAKILWEGILIKDILKEVEPKSDAKIVIFHAYDGYTTSLPIDYIEEKNIIIAYKMNNVTLLPERGFPFQLVAESKWGYKWIKWITEIEISENEYYKGYWESRGYSNNANLNESFFD